MKLPVVLIAASSLIYGAVIQLNEENFDQIVLSSKPVLVEFYAPWCGHCKSLELIYEQLGEAFSHKTDELVIAKIDADMYKAVGKRFDIKGFPTLKWFTGRSHTPEDYSSGRQLKDFIDFIKEKTGLSPRKIVEPVVALKESNFDDQVLSKNKHVLVEFYAPWCGHCKNLEPTYRRVAAAFAGDPDIVIAKVDATDPAAQILAERFDIKSFPTIKFFSKTIKEPIDYTGARTEEALMGYLNKMCGTFRTIDGGLNNLAGRIPHLDTLAHQLASGVDVIETITRQMKEFVTSVSSNSSSEYYLHVVEKLKTNKNYVLEEITRREGMLSKGGLAKEKEDEFSIRRNILKAFLPALNENIVKNEKSEQIHEEL